AMSAASSWLLAARPVLPPMRPLSPRGFTIATPSDSVKISAPARRAACGRSSRPRAGSAAAPPRSRRPCGASGRSALRTRPATWAARPGRATAGSPSSPVGSWAFPSRAPEKPLCEVVQDALRVLAVRGLVDDLALLLDELPDVDVDGAVGEEVIRCDAVALADAVAAVLGLVVVGEIGRASCRERV